MMDWRSVSRSRGRMTVKSALSSPSAAYQYMLSPRESALSRPAYLRIAVAGWLVIFAGALLVGKSTTAGNSRPHSVHISVTAPSLPVTSEVAGVAEDRGAISVTPFTVKQAPVTDSLLRDHSYWFNRTPVGGDIAGVSGGGDETSTAEESATEFSDSTALTRLGVSIAKDKGTRESVILDTSTTTTTTTTTTMSDGVSSATSTLPGTSSFTTVPSELDGSDDDSISADGSSNIVSLPMQSQGYGFSDVLSTLRNLVIPADDPVIDAIDE